MFSRKHLLMLGLVGGTVGPIVATTQPWAHHGDATSGAERPSASMAGLFGPSNEAAGSRVGSLHGEVSQQTGDADSGSDESPTTNGLDQVLRFDISPRWVTSRWPRVTTTLSEWELQGMRVPLVTGTQIDDLAGSLTYYFDQNHQLQRITFFGTTGDERKLVKMLTEQFGFRREPILAAGLYINRWNGEPTSVLRVSHSFVVSADAPHRRLNVMFEINRPGLHYQLSDQFRQLIDSDQHTQRWNGRPIRPSQPTY